MAIFIFLNKCSLFIFQALSTPQIGGECLKIFNYIFQIPIRKN